MVYSEGGGFVMGHQSKVEDFKVQVSNFSRFTKLWNYACHPVLGYPITPVGSPAHFPFLSPASGKHCQFLLQTAFTGYFLEVELYNVTPICLSHTMLLESLHTGPRVLFLFNWWIEFNCIYIHSNFLSFLPFFIFSFFLPCPAFHIPSSVSWVLAMWPRLALNSKIPALASQEPRLSVYYHV